MGIGLGGCEVRLLRSRLALDSGYLSRLLRSLEAAGLAEVSPSSSDARIRVARLTRAGRRERVALDRRSDELAESLLAPLSAEQQDRLVRAMREVERLLIAAGVEIASVDPEHPDAQYCVAEYVAELNRRSTRGFDPSIGATALPHEVRRPAGGFFVAYLHGEPIGCGAVKHHPNAPAEIKRMWIAPKREGSGSVGACSRRWRRALGRAARVAHIETSAVLTEALSLSAVLAGLRCRHSMTSHLLTTGSRKNWRRPGAWQNASVLVSAQRSEVDVTPEMRVAETEQGSRDRLLGSRATKRPPLLPAVRPCSPSSISTWSG